MSWSINLLGKAAAVAKAFEERAAEIKCVEPEESAKSAVADILTKLAATMPDSSAIRVEASGSQSPAYDAHYKVIEGKLSHSLNVKIESIYGFVE